MKIQTMLKRRAEKNRKLKKAKTLCKKCGDPLTLPDEIKYGVCRGCASLVSDETSEDKWRTDAYIESKITERELNESGKD